MQTLTKYNTSSEYGTPDNLTNLQDMDDAVTASLGNGARTPTKEEWNELISNTTVEWTTMNGVYGSKFTADNGNSIFLPATGLCDGSGLPLPAVSAVTGPRRSTTSILTARSTSSSFRATGKWTTTTALAASHSAQCVPIKSNEKILLMKKNKQYLHIIEY